MAEAVGEKLLAAVDAGAEAGVTDTGPWAAAQGLDHGAVVGAIKSLTAHELILAEEVVTKAWRLTEEAEGYLTDGSAEFRVFAAVPAEGIPLKELQAATGEAGKVGFKQAMQQKWIAMDKAAGLVVRKVGSVEDTTQAVLRAIHGGGAVDDKTAAALKKRKLVKQEVVRTYKVTKGPKFALQLKKAATDLTHDMLRDGSWRTDEFKQYNFNSLGILPAGGHLHPLLKVRTQYRKIFVQMGFEEMPTNKYVESSFWNFDALFQPQQHPARDAHDTFFLTNPATCNECPEEYLARVKDVHENGGYGSVGYRYMWKRSEANKNLLRTHTTAVSSRMLEKLARQTEAQGFWEPKRYFSVDRVFRNETVDKTHLAEFHQVEGLVADKGLTLGDLIGTIKQFFTRLGMPDVRFKPAYNPYTEPSMEIFAYHAGLGKWVEVGNSGMFRPEMLRPMGLPEDVNVIAWGLSVERPTMILYGINNIRDLFGHKVDLQMIKTNPICRLGF